MILDEPTNGLDPRGIAEMRELIRTIARQGKTIILASHLLDEVQKVCSHFAVLNKGKLLYSGLVNEVSGDDQRIELSAGDMDQLYTLLENYPGKETLNVQKTGLLSPSRLIPRLPISAVIFTSMVWCPPICILHKSLEKQFLDILNESK